MKPRRILFRSALLADGSGYCCSPGAILVQGSRILASGTPQHVGQPPDVEVIDLPHATIIPALVNVHAHLDLTHIGPQPYTGTFTSWVNMIRGRRVTHDHDIAESVRLGVELSRRGGTALIGDIAGISSRTPIAVQREAGLPGVSYFEVFGNGQRQDYASSVLRSAVSQMPKWERGVMLGLQPHAPYSCGIHVYRTAVELGLPLSTHLAETLEELEFVATGKGPIKQMILQIGAWDESMTGTHQHPVDYLAPAICGSGCLAAHLNYLDHPHLRTLQECGINAAYCPRASAYFEHPHQKPHQKPHQHRYRQMIEHGINVALGTDSIVCLDTPDRISVLDEMRLLHRRDGTDPQLLLKMATINGAAALGFDPQLFTMAPGPTAGLLAVESSAAAADGSLAGMLRSDVGPRWLAGPFEADDSWRRPASA